MNGLPLVFFLALASIASLPLFGAPENPASPMKPYGLVIHGGAGVILRKNMTPETEHAYRIKLQEALDSGYAVLDRGGTAPDAVIAVITILEDSPLFNAGYGAVLDSEGICELDAAIMDGKTEAAGAVAGVQHIKNPITLARAVMEKSRNVMLIGDGAEKFAQQIGFELVPNTYFQTDRRRKELERAKELEKKEAADKTQHSQLEPGHSENSGSFDSLIQERKWGTVGCAALDKNGNLAAGTSTGGLTNKKYGRVGDSPIIGAGTYADNATCAVSCTGTGEYFMRVVVGHDIAAQMKYANKSLAEAADATLAKVGQLGGDGGLIAIDHNGNVAMPFNTPGMYRGFKLSTGSQTIALYGADK